MESNIITEQQKNIAAQEQALNQTPPSSGFRKWAPLLVLSLALAIIIIDTTILNVSLRTIINDLRTDITSIQWVITAYALILAAFTITGGRMGDLFGRKKMFMLGAAIFAIGSFTASISKSVGVLIIGEAVIEGIGAVLMLPATASLLVSTYKGRDRATAFGIWGGIAAASAAIGPILGGYLTSHFTWRWAFRVNVFVAALLLLGSMIIKESFDQEEKPKLDLVGVVLSALGLLAIVYGVIEAETYGWLKAAKTFYLFHNPVNLGGASVVPFFIVIGLALLGAFVLWEKYMDSAGKTPLVSLNLFRNKQFTSGAVTMGILSLGQAGLFFSLPVFLQAVKNLDAFRTGLALLPLALAALVAAPLSAFLSKKISPKLLIQIGLLLDIASFIVLRSVLKVDVTNWQLLPGLILFGLGLGTMMSQINNLTMSAISVQEAGEASGVNNTLRQVGATLGSAILGAVLISAMTANLKNDVLKSNVIPPPLKQSISQAFSQNASEIEFGSTSQFAGNAPQAIKDEMVRIVKQGTVDANRTTLVFGALFIFFGFLVSFTLPGAKEVETEQSIAHKDIIAIQEEKIRRLKYRTVIASVLVAAAAGSGGYLIAKHKFQKNQASTSSAPIATVPLAGQTSSQGNSVPAQNGNPGPATQPVQNLRGAQAPSQARTYSNADWHIAFTVSTNGEVSAKRVSGSTMSFYDTATGKELGSVQKYDSVNSANLDVIEQQLRGSRDITKISRITFSGLPAIEFWSGDNDNIAVIKDNNLYYLSGQLITSQFRFM